MNNNGSTIWARQTIESDVFFWKPDKWFKIWFYIVNRVNYEDTKLFEKGSAYIEYKEIALKTGSTYSQVEKFVKWAKHEGMLKTEKSTRGNIIIVLNYAKYQDSIKQPKGKHEAKQKRSTSDAIGETLKEIKEVKEKEKKERVWASPTTPAKNFEPQQLPLQPEDVTGKKTGAAKMTPGDKAKSFFSKGELYKKAIDNKPQHVLKEIEKFINYWTEPNKSGTKERWELQKTFDVERRFNTWMTNAQKYAR